MVRTLEFTVALCAVLMLMSHCQPAHLHPPKNLMYEWADLLTVNVSWSWERPKGLPKDCKTEFEFKLHSKSKRTIETHFLENLLTENSTEWVYSIRTVGTSLSCKDWNSSASEIVVKTSKPRAEVKDFRCYLTKSGMDCSWIKNPFPLLSLSYRECGKISELLGNFRECNLSSISEQRRGCHLKENFLQKQLCMVANTHSNMSTFKVEKAVRLPKMNISEEETKLVLTMMPLEVELENKCLLYNICYSVCNKHRGCLEYSVSKGPRTIPYDKSCQYKFKYTLKKNAYCSYIKSDPSEEIEYGSDVTDGTLTVVAIVIPIIVSACVILSCICFRRHKDIICPDIPDPSIIFKEMINDNKEIKTKISTYTPVPEPIKRLTIVPDIPENA